MTDSVNQSINDLDGVGPVDNRPSTAEAPPIGKIHPFSKMGVTHEPVMQFRCLQDLKSPILRYNPFYDSKHHLQHLGCGGAVKIFSQTISY